jgi:excinuclease UvrABC nuclease subunit
MSSKSGYFFALEEAPDTSGVYFLYQENILVYIGKSDTSVKKRILNHDKDKKDFNSYRYIYVPPNQTRKVEKDELKKYMKRYGQLPFYNRQK